MSDVNISNLYSTQRLNLFESDSSYIYAWVLSLMKTL